MLNFEDGRVIAKITGGRYNGKILYLTDKEKCRGCFASIEIKGKIEPLLNVDERTVSYIAGPSGSGKTTYAVELIKKYKKIFPDKEFYLFSRTNHENDPVFQGMDVNQVEIDEDLLDDPIDIETELNDGSVLLFDDCNTIQNDKLKKSIDKLMADIMEVGRKLDITIIITNHLVIPNEKKMARTVLNEMQVLTVFPKSGSVQQIKYVLKTYFGLDNKQMNYIVSLPSRWVTIYKNYPMCVLYEGGCFIL
jgi:hypothetical protein